MRITAIIVIFGLWLTAPAARAQDFPEIDDEHASEALAQSLEYFSSHPVNLNHAALQDLSAIPLLYPSEALRMARYLMSHPALSDPGLLVRDSVITQQTLEDILPYICVDRPGQRGRPLIDLRTLQQAKRPPFVPPPAVDYHGPSWSSTLKARVRPDQHWELTALAQKDPGERSIADYSSAGAAYASASAVRNVVLGDYQLAFGHGLQFGGSSPVFLSAQYMGSVAVNPSRVAPNFSTSEWSSLRGAVVTVAIGDALTATGFGSARRRDARLDSLGDLQSLDYSGYHRSDAEIARLGAIGERLAGLRLESAVTGGLQLGLTGYGQSFTPGRAGQPRWQTGAGLDASYTTARGQLFIDAAVPSSRQPALLGGGQFVAARYRTFILLRQYGRGYTGPRFNGLSAYGGGDEQGVSIGSSLALPGKTTTAAVYDQARPLSTAGRLEQGDGTSRIETFLSNSLIPGLQLEWRWRRYRSEEGASDSFRSDTRTASRMGLRWQAGSALAVTVRYEVDRVRQDGIAEMPRGDLLTIGVGGGPWRGLRVAAVTAFFTAHTYDARLYAAEPELTGSGSFHAYYGSGRRDVLLVRYRYARLLTLEGKVARQLRDYQGVTQRQTEGGLSILVGY